MPVLLQVQITFLLRKGTTAAFEPHQGCTFNSRVIFSAIIDSPSVPEETMLLETYRRFLFVGEAAVYALGTPH